MKTFIIATASFLFLSFCYSLNKTIVIDNDFAKNPFEDKITSKNIKNILKCNFDKDIQTYENTHNSQLIDTFYIYKKQDTKLYFIKSVNSIALIKVEINDNVLTFKKDIKIGMDLNTFKSKFSIEYEVLGDTITVTDDENWDSHDFIFNNGKLTKVNVFFSYN